MRCDAMSTDPNNLQERVGDDLLVGASAIADEMGMEAHGIYYAHKKKLLPIKKWGKHLIASRSQLRRAARALTSTAQT
jgi:hypothetical protein